LCEGLFIPTNENDALYKLQKAVQLNQESQAIQNQIKKALKNQQLSHDSYENVVQEALVKELISQEEYTQVLEAYHAKQEVINVDAFDTAVYKEQK